MSFLIFLFNLEALVFAASVENHVSTVQYASSVDFSILEEFPKAQHRARKLVLDEFEQVMKSRKRLDTLPYEIRNTNDEVHFYIVSSQDMKNLIEGAILDLVHRLNGRARTRGVLSSYRASSKKQGGYLEIQMNPERKHELQTLVVRSVPLGDVLRELKVQVGDFSSVIHGQCANKPLTWTWSEAQYPGLQSVLTNFAASGGFTLSRRGDAYVFSGSCEMETADNVAYAEELPDAAIAPVQMLFPFMQVKSAPRIEADGMP